MSRSPRNHCPFRFHVEHQPGGRPCSARMGVRGMTTPLQGLPITTARRCPGGSSPTIRLLQDSGLDPCFTCNFADLPGCPGIGALRTSSTHCPSVNRAARSTRWSARRRPVGGPFRIPEPSPRGGSEGPAAGCSRCLEFALGPILPPSMPLVGRTPDTGVPFNFRY